MMSQCERPTGKEGAKTQLPPVPKLPSPAKTDPKANPKADPKTPTPTNPKAKPKVKTKPRGRKLGVGDDATVQAPHEGEGAEEGPWEGALKRLTFEEPHVIAALKGLDASTEYGLIDGGATHCLRYGPPGEYDAARSVEVHLASGSTQELRMNPVGTLLSANPEIQPILPMGLLASELGCHIR